MITPGWTPLHPSTLHNLWTAHKYFVPSIKTNDNIDWSQVAFYHVFIGVMFQYAPECNILR